MENQEISPRYRLSKLFFYALLVFLPFQTRKIFFTPESHYFGYHAFYNTIYLYLTDLIIFGLIMAWLWENLNFSQKNHTARGFFHRILTRTQQDALYWFLGAFWLILATSLIFSRETLLGLYGLGKITEFVFLFAFVKEEIDFSREKYLIFWLILATFSFQAMLGIAQYLKQSSLDLRLLGEEFLRPGVPGIAEFASHGVVSPWLAIFLPYLSPISDSTINIRAYGTLPHPNVLAGLLFAGLIIACYIVYVSPASAKAWAGRRENVFVSFAMILIITGLILTFSRLAWIVAFLGIIAWFGLIFAKIRRIQVFSREKLPDYHPGRLALILGFLSAALVINLLVFGPQIRDRLQGSTNLQNYQNQESVVNRALLNNIALRMIRQNPLFGVGLKNFVVAMDDFGKERLLPYLHQPVHNIYLLLTAEGGVLAGLSFVIFLFCIVRRLWENPDLPLRLILLTVISGFFVIGLFDHYLLTIQQGALAFWITLGFSANKNWTVPDLNR